MSGVQTGSRVEQLEKLLARVQQELAAERLKSHTDAVDPRGGIYTHPDEPVSRLVAEQRRPSEPCQVSSRTVKEWALAQNLISHIPRARVNSALVEAYEKAHGIRVVVVAGAR